MLAHFTTSLYRPWASRRYGGSITDLSSVTDVLQQRLRLQRFRSRLTFTRRKKPNDADVQSIDSTETRVTRAFSRKKSVAGSLRSLYPHGSVLDLPSTAQLEAESKPEPISRTAVVCEPDPGLDPTVEHTLPFSRKSSMVTMNTLNTVSTWETLEDTPPGSIYMKTRETAGNLCPQSRGVFYADISSLERLPTKPAQAEDVIVSRGQALIGQAEEQDAAPTFQSTTTNRLSRTKTGRERVKSRLKRRLTAVRTRLRKSANSAL